MKPSAFTRDQLSTNISSLLETGTSCSLIGASGTGKEAFQKQITSKLKNSSFIEVDIDELITIDQTEFLELMAYKLSLLQSGTETSSIRNEPINISISKKINHLVKEERSLVIIIRGVSKLFQLPQSFFNLLNYFRRIKRSKIAYLFIDQPKLENILEKIDLGELYELINSKKFYLPYPTLKEFDEVTNYSEEVFDIKINRNLSKIAHSLTNGHFGISHYIFEMLRTRNSKELEGIIIDEPKQLLPKKAISLRLQKIVDQLSLNQRTILEQISCDELSMAETVEVDIKKLLDYQLIKKTAEEECCRINIPLLKLYLGNTSI